MSPKKPSFNRTGKAPTKNEGTSGNQAPSNKVKKLSRTGQSSRTVKDPSKTSGNRPRQGEPVPDTSRG